MKTTYYRQYELESGISQLVTWLEDDDRVQVGTKLTLKGIDDTVWKVTARYNVVLDESPRQVWKVGGLT